MFLLLFLAYALVIGLCIAWIWSSLFDTHGPWNSFFWFFFVIFLFAWGGGAWIAPFGPTSYGVAWLPLIILGVFMALLLTAVTPRSSRPRRRATDRRPAVPAHGAGDETAVERLETAASADYFFWALLLVFGFVILSSLLWHPRIP